MARSASIRRRLHRLAQFSREDRALLFEATLRLVWLRLVLMAVPFPLLMQRAGVFVPPQDPRALRAAQPADPAEAAMARRIGWAVSRAARHLPFEVVCLPQALAARAILGRRGIASAMHFGAGRGTKKPLEAHAWLDAAGVEVTGYPVAESYVELACIV
jgi:hypothetical protein